MLVLWTFGTYQVAYSRSHRINTPEGAIKQFLIQNHLENAQQITVLPEMAETGGGFFMVARNPIYNTYQVFYTSVQNGTWTAISTGQSYQPNLSQGAVMGETNGPAVESNWIVVSTVQNPKIAAVVAYTRLEGTGDEIPFSLTEVGNLPLWVYKYSTATFLTDYIVEYDRAGHVVWSSQAKR